jgi:hypothetical protein
MKVAGCAQKTPLPPSKISSLFFSICDLCITVSAEPVDPLADVVEPVQVRPMGGNADEDAADGLSHFAGHFDEQRSPRGDVALAQRIALTAVAMIPTTLVALERRDRQRGIGHRYALGGGITWFAQRGWIDRHAEQDDGAIIVTLSAWGDADEPIQSRGVEHQTKVVGHESAKSEDR